MKFTHKMWENKKENKMKENEKRNNKMKENKQRKNKICITIYY